MTVAHSYLPEVALNASMNDEAVAGTITRTSHTLEMEQAVTFRFIEDLDCFVEVLRVEESTCGNPNHILWQVSDLSNMKWRALETAIEWSIRQRDSIQGWPDTLE